LIGRFLLLALACLPAAAAELECTQHVGYDRDLDLPGYLIGKDCVAVTVTAAKPPAGYKGDFYVDEFTDAKLRQRWKQCQADSACNERLSAHIARRLPPNREHNITDPHALYLLGKIDGDLRQVRRPAFFKDESIAAADSQTYLVEFTAPPEPYERIRQGASADIKLRGWYIKGDGVDDGKGHKVHALALMSMGGGGRLVAIEDPADTLFHMDPVTGKSVLHSFPNATTGASGQRGWRRYLDMLHKAGFDVLSYDRRGVGLSEGYSDTNTLQQGRDILKVIADLKSGDGVRVIGPDGAELPAAALQAGDLPVLLGGSSRGTMAAGWAMSRNFDKQCDYDLPDMPCSPKVGLANIKGAMMLADFTAGVGYLTAPTEQQDADRGLFLAGSEVGANIVFFPSSAILASVHKWPALFIGRGTYDYAESLEGAIDAYRRVKGLKELAVAKGPHPFETWSEADQLRVGERMVAFARAAVLREKTVAGGRPWRTEKELAATAE